MPAAQLQAILAAEEITPVEHCCIDDFGTREAQRAHLRTEVLRRKRTPQRLAGRAHDLEAANHLLESSVLAQGLPKPQNREAASRMVRAVEHAGAAAAITGVVHGVPSLGLTAHELERFLAQTGVRKVSARDIPITVQQRRDGATTVAASLANLGVASGFSVGGFFSCTGGVHATSSTIETLVPRMHSDQLAGAGQQVDIGGAGTELEQLGVARPLDPAQR